eukprot:Lithocolla_globosa_v1_NODE_4872_length_1348_cov_16.268368.p2 type:complete len:154 gc:universal NODE_4872_length_1348_cov_16.268368:645-184(-)
MSSRTILHSSVVWVSSICVTPTLLPKSWSGLKISLRTTNRLKSVLVYMLHKLLWVVLFVTCSSTKSTLLLCFPPFLFLSCETSSPLYGKQARMKGMKQTEAGQGLVPFLAVLKTLTGLGHREEGMPAEVLLPSLRFLLETGHQGTEEGADHHV